MSLPASFDLTPEDAKLLLAANVHLGAKNVQVCFQSQLFEGFIVNQWTRTEQVDERRQKDEIDVLLSICLEPHCEYGEQVKIIEKEKLYPLCERRPGTSFYHLLPRSLIHAI